ncbi:MAG TPA: molybdopterin-binding protein [Candidatus Limnocylindrales bacterium]|jgi:nicotinamide-nucleotide amidase|nr:molybdopterin-binding protein [Candidatus Limnocylindrales bacterium]
MPTPPQDRPLRTAEILSIGSELTVGETRDTNGGELARALSLEGVSVGRITAVPDRLDVVTDSFRAALERADLVVSTGGLGPTPDDLTRESIATAVGEEPIVDPDLETWLRGRWARRGLPFPEINLKQAWVLPSCAPLPNPNGSAPGWLVTRPDGRVIAAMPGPPREMRPMWENEVLPRLKARGLGRELAVRTFRLTGIGESQVAEILGEELLRSPDPEVATYARLEAVDVRVSASGSANPCQAGASAQVRVAEASAIVLERLGAYVWAEGDTTWAAALGERLGQLGWRLAIEEMGTGGQLAALLGDVPWLALAEGRPLGGPDNDDGGGGLLERARRVRSTAAVEVGLAVRARPRGSELAVSVAIVTPNGEHRQTRTTYTGGSMGRSQAALLAAASLFAALRDA